MKSRNKQQMRESRHKRIRKKISGTAERPRMAISRSNRSMSVQFVDDDNGKTLAAAHLAPGAGGCDVAAATELGKTAAAAAQDKGITLVVVDRGGFRYHGRVKALVESVMEAGLSTSAKEDK